MHGKNESKYIWFLFNYKKTNTCTFHVTVGSDSISEDTPRFQGPARELRQCRSSDDRTTPDEVNELAHPVIRWPVVLTWKKRQAQNIPDESVRSSVSVM